MKKKLLLLLGIVFVAGILRFYQLNVNPPALTWDEAAWGYNAYSLGIDGRDEFGKFLPYQYLESFGDFKPPLYAYLDILPVKLLGLNEFSARFPSALFGTLTVLLTYFLVKELFRGTKRDYSEVLGLLSAFILAISPWHIILSRAAFEANVASFFIIFAVYAFLRGVHDKSYFLILSAISFVLSMYTFNSARIVSPLLVVVLVIFMFKKLWQMKPMAISAGIIGFLILLPIIPFLFSPQAKLRYQEVNIFSDVNLVKLSNQEIDNAHGAWWAKLTSNRRVIYGREFLKHYFDNLSLNFLFIQGDGNPKFSTQEVGELYIWMLPFLVVGAFFLFRNREGSWYMIPLWLLLGIIPAATARETPHALRIEATLPTFQILAAYGVVNCAILLKKYQKVFMGVVGAAILICLVYFLHGYYYHYPVQYSGEWQYGYKDSIAYVHSVENNYDNIVVTGGLGRPYIYYLFYLQVPPQVFRQTGIVKRDPFGFVTVEGFSTFQFPITVQSVPGKTLYILEPSDKLPGSAKLLKTFYLLNGGQVLKAYEN